MYFKFSDAQWDIQGITPTINTDCIELSWPEPRAEPSDCYLISKQADGGTWSDVSCVAKSSTAVTYCAPTANSCIDYKFRVYETNITTGGALYLESSSVRYGGIAQ